MKMKNYVLAMAMAIFSLAACDQTVDTPVPGTSGRVIEFESEIGAFTKATASAFEDGDVIGLSVSAPVSVSNVRLTCTNGVLVPESPIYWAENQGDNDKADFVAVYPYSQSSNPAQPVQVTIPEDLSATGAYVATDLIGAKASASPADSRVRLPFAHLLSRFVVTVNHAEGASVASVVLDGTKVQGQVDISNSGVAVFGDAKAVKPATATTADTYVWLVVPQEADPVIVVELSDGRSYRFTASSKVEFAQGKQLVSTVTVEGPSEIKFDADIVDWDEIDVDLGGGSGRGGHGIVSDGYYIYSGSHDGFFPMEKQDDGTYTGSLPSYSGGLIAITLFDDFETHGELLRYGASVDDVYGLEDKVRLIPGGYGVFVNYRGPLGVTFDPSGSTLTFNTGKWNELGTGQWIATFLDAFTGSKNEVLDVTVYESDLASGLYKVENPYRNSVEWEKYYVEGGYFLVDATSAGRVYLPSGNPVGIHIDGFGDADVESYVEENGWNADGNYGYMYDGVVYLPARSCVLTLSEYGSVLCNRNGYFQLALPGAKRSLYYTSFNSIPEFTGTEVLADGTHVATYGMNLGLDVKALRYIVYSGRVSREDIIAKAVPAVRANADGVVTVQDAPTEEDFRVSIPYTNGGIYTVLFYAEGPDNTYFSWQFQSDLWDVEGSAVPDFSLAISASAHDKMPDRIVEYHVDFPTLKEGWTALVPKSEFYASHTDSDIYDYTLSHGSAINSYYFSGTSGMDFQTYTQPGTTFLAMAAGEDFYGRSGYAVAEVTTAGAATFTELGTGKYYDLSGIIADSYVTDVKILKSQGSADYYHVDNVYENYWQNADSLRLRNYRPEYRNDSFDFFFREDGGTEYIFYSEFIPGYVVPDFNTGEGSYGLLVMEHGALFNRTPSTNAYCVNNVRLSEGVYSISPYGTILNTGYMYAFYSATGNFVLAMPGHEYSAPSRQSAPAVRKNTEPRNLVERLPAITVGAKVESGGTEFSRHAFKTAAPRLTVKGKESSPVLNDSVSKISKK